MHRHISRLGAFLLTAGALTACGDDPVRALAPAEGGAAVLASMLSPTDQPNERFTCGAPINTASPSSAAGDGKTTRKVSSKTSGSTSLRSPTQACAC